MKKLLLIFAMIFFTAALSAADDTPVPAESSEKPVNPVYFQGTLGFATGSSLFSLSTDFNLGFLVAHTKRENNIYLGIDADFRYNPYKEHEHSIEVPLQLNFAVDFKMKNVGLQYSGFWISGGVDLTYGVDCATDSHYRTVSPSWQKQFRLKPAWAAGGNFIFKYNIVLRTALYGFYGKYPNVLVSAGYRF